MPDEFDIASRLKFGAAGPGASDMPRPWEPIETAPSYQNVLVYLPWCRKIALARRAAGRAGIVRWHAAFSPGSSIWLDITPSHWMPLPEPPEAALALAREQTQEKTDPREPDYSRPGIFAHHNCWKCDSGKRPCAQGTPNQCEYPIARND